MNIDVGKYKSVALGGKKVNNRWPGTYPTQGLMGYGKKMITLFYLKHIGEHYYLLPTTYHLAPTT